MTGVGSAFLADFFGDRTGWDPAQGAYIVGGGSITALTTAIAGNTIGFLPNVGRGIAWAQLGYDGYRISEGNTYELRLFDAADARGLWGFATDSWSFAWAP